MSARDSARDSNLSAKDSVDAVDLSGSGKKKTRRGKKKRKSQQESSEPIDELLRKQAKRGAGINEDFEGDLMVDGKKT